MNSSRYLWGIDLGGTKIEGVILERKYKTVVYRERIDTESALGYENVLSRIKKLIGLMEAHVGEMCKIIGIGTPGTSDPQTNLLKNCNTTHLNHKPFVDDLKKLLKKDLIIANDANCFALAEANMGIVQDIDPPTDLVFGVIIGTGVGGGLVVNGKVLNGRQGIAGEWGHNYLDDSGGLCYCGKMGCVETVIAGPHLERYYLSLTGKKKKLKEIAALVKSDSSAAKTIDRLHHFFGLAISSVINILDPDVIVIGGGVGNIKSIYEEGIKKAEHFVFNNRLNTKIVAPKLGDSAGVFGAALLTTHDPKYFV